MRIVIASILMAISMPVCSEPLNVISVPLGKTQSECLSQATERVKAMVPNVDHGGEKAAGRVVFGTDKPYYVAVLCEGTSAFFAVSGPDSKVRGEMWQKFQKATRPAGSKPEKAKADKK